MQQALGGDLQEGFQALLQPGLFGIALQHLDTAFLQLIAIEFGRQALGLLPLTEN